MGAGLEYWAVKVLDNTSDSARVLILSRGRELMQDTHDHGEDGHAHAEGNPHLWLDPVFAIDAAEQILELLISISPQHATALRRRASAWTDSLRALDEEIRLARSGWTQRSFIGDHSSWVYFAARYDLEQSGVVEAVPGREISAQSMGALIERMRASGVRAIFADVRKNPHAMEVLAEATGAGIAWLDPIGSEGSALRYLDLMRYNMREMTRVMR
jgi:ABC-type Zn uptake system ZnuABC Zn-binding protein ZnuA